MAQKKPSGMSMAVLKAGSQYKLAALLGVTQPTIHNYVTGAVLIPTERALTIEKKLGIPRSKLRPDLFGKGG